ncbi:leucine-rich repeat family protein [Striga asiatica]|uniref:Leucine-rich repeat family protein n=1 Tax=Striga asiatica TaxID=4170 RepID=A0A5A7Q7G5_STRAF|nr:leucine-rich repeat family protein [Striga asiatica]
MTRVPRLIDLCMAAIADELLQGDENGDMISVIYELPSELFESLLPHLPPLALQKLQENLPFNFRYNFGSVDDYQRDCRKRRRYGVLDKTWRSLHKVRWPGFRQQKLAMAQLNKIDHAEGDSIDDWQQMYWEAHLQECVDSVAETALLPSYDGSIGEIQIPDGILEHIGCKSHLVKLTYDCIKFSWHCEKFGVYARQLRLPNALCVAETCDLLQSSKLGSLELQWIKSNDHAIYSADSPNITSQVEGLCKLLNQNSGTLKSIDFIHCKLSPTLINAICDSLDMNGLQSHGVEHFLIKRSSFLQSDSSPVPIGLISFLTCGRSLRSLTLCDNQLGRNFARVVFNSLIDASTSISKLDLSENNISGFLSQFRWRSSSISLEMCKSLKSLRVLNLRSCNLVRDDAECLKQALVHIPNLENLDLSDNLIDDGIRSLLSYFREISSRGLPFAELKLENCELTCEHVIELLGALSNMNKPLKLLSVKGNRLGSKIGASLGKFLCTGICSLDVEDIGLGSSGFLEAGRNIARELKIVYINISNNQGGIEAAKFISSLISHARKIVAVDARYNIMPLESLSVISSSLKAFKGKLEHLDLGGNWLCDQLADATSVLAELQSHGQFSFNLLLSTAPNVPYDDDP